MPDYMNKAEEKLWNEAKKIVQKEYKKDDPKYWGTIQNIYQAKKKKHLGKDKKGKKKMKKSDLYAALIKKANIYMESGDLRAFDQLTPVMRRLNKEAIAPEELAGLTPQQLGTQYETLFSQRSIFDEQLDATQDKMESGLAPNPGEAGDRIRVLNARIEEIDNMLAAIQSAYEAETGGRYVTPEAPAYTITPMEESEPTKPKARVRKKPKAVSTGPAKPSAEELADGAAVRQLADPEEEGVDLRNEILRRIFISARRGIGQTLADSERMLGRNMIEYLENKVTGGQPSEELTAGLTDLTFTDEIGTRLSPEEMNARILKSLNPIEQNMNLHADNIEDQAKDFWRQAASMREQPMEEVLSFAAQIDQNLATMLRKAGHTISRLVHSFDKMISKRTGRTGIERTGPVNVRRRMVDDPSMPHIGLPDEYRTEISGPAKGRKGRRIAPIPMEGRAPTAEEIEEVAKEPAPRFSPEKMRGRRNIPLGRKVVRDPLRKHKEEGESAPSKRKDRPLLELPEEESGIQSIRRTRLPKRRK